MYVMELANHVAIADVKVVWLLNWEDLIKVNVYLMTQHQINTLIGFHAL